MLSVYASNISIYIFFFASFAVSTPISPLSSSSSSSQAQYKSWSPEPDGRGTVSIVLSCLTTLLFCASKILKPNLLPPGWHGRSIQLAQILAGMFVPEVVYLMALGQFFDAKGVRDTINKQAESFSWGGKSHKDSEWKWSLGKLRDYFRFDKEPNYIELVCGIRF